MIMIYKVSIWQLYNTFELSVMNRSQTAWEGHWATPGAKDHEKVKTKPRNQPSPGPFFPCPKTRTLSIPSFHEPFKPPSLPSSPPSPYLGWSHLCPPSGPGSPLHHRLLTETVSRPHNQMNDRTYFSTSLTLEFCESVCFGFGMMNSTF